MDSKKNKFIHFPENYSNELQDLIDYCETKQRDAESKLLDYRSKFSSLQDKLKIGRIKSKQNQKYMKLYSKNINILSKIKDEKKREKAKITVENYASSIRDNINELKNLKAQIESIGNPEKIQKNIEIFDAYEDLFEDLNLDLDQYSTYVTTLSVTVQSYEISGVGNETSIMKIQDKIIELEKKLKMRLSKLIATGMKILKDKLPTRLSDYDPTTYTIEKMISERKTKLKHIDLKKELNNIQKQIDQKDNIKT